MADTKDILRKIRDQKMDRKDFLKYSGIVLVGMTGLRATLALLSQADPKKSVAESTTPVSHGFGSGKYGA